MQHNTTPIDLWTITVQDQPWHYLIARSFRHAPPGPVPVKGMERRWSLLPFPALDWATSNDRLRCGGKGKKEKGNKEQRKEKACAANLSEIDLEEGASCLPLIPSALQGSRNSTWDEMSDRLRATYMYIDWHDYDVTWAATSPKADAGHVYVIWTRPKIGSEKRDGKMRKWAKCMWKVSRWIGRC